MERETFLIQLKGLQENLLHGFEQVASLDDGALNFKSTPDSWSILECLEHLNRYGDFYLPEIEARILNASPEAAKHQFRSGWLGNYFVKMIRVKDGSIKKMKTVKSMDPSASSLDRLVLDRFFKQQKRYLQLLQEARQYDLQGIKTRISILPFFKMRLGDTFRFLIYHHERHLLQVQRILQVVATTRPSSTSTPARS